MDQNYKNFIKTLHSFIDDLNRYNPSENLKEILNVYEQLDMAKVIFKIHTVLKESGVKIDIEDDSLFKTPINILPGVDLSCEWEKLSKGQKDKMWTYLKILKLETDILMDFNKTSISNTNKEHDDIEPEKKESEGKELVRKESDEKKSDEIESDEKKPLEFNPYTGIGNNNQTYGVNDLYAATPTFAEDKPTGAGIETIANMIGINKYVNIEELTNQLKNMKKEDIENATNNIKNLLGTDNNNTSIIISDMLTNIQEELKNNDMSSGDPFKKILKVAELVAGKMKNQLQEKQINISDLLSSTQSVANKCVDKDGKPIFSDKMNPFALINQLTSSLNPNSSPQELNNNLGQYQNILKNMGINLNGMNQNNSSNQSKRGKRKKK